MKYTIKTEKYIFIVAFLLSCNSVFGDSFSWTGEGLTTLTGKLLNTNHIYKVQYKIGYRLGGFGHLESAVEIKWCDLDKKKHTQVIFEGMTDWKPKSVKIYKPSSTIRITFEQPLDPDPEDILQPDLIYSYNPDKVKFEKK